MILRLSQKLSTKIEAGKFCKMPLDENPHANSGEVAPPNVDFGLNDLLLSEIATKEEGESGRPKYASKRLSRQKK